MVKKKCPLVVFGFQPFATWAAKTLIASGYYDLLGVVTRESDRDYSHHRLPDPPLASWASAAGIPILTDEQLRSLMREQSGLLGLSARWDKIFDKSTIDGFDRGIVNCHGGLLPRWRGVDVPTHLILEGAEEGGATLHLVDENVDTGPIIDRDSFVVGVSDTAYDIYLKVQDSLIGLIRENSESLMDAFNHAKPQQEYLNRGEEARVYKMGVASKLRRLSWPQEFDTLLRHARAYSFPGRPSAELVGPEGSIGLRADHQTRNMPTSWC